MIPVSHLVEGGRYTAPPEEQELQPTEVVRSRRAERDVAVLQGELAAAQQRGDVLQEQLDFMRTLLDQRAA